jgi:DNA-binding GntR family transcriptional regulator
MRLVLENAVIELVCDIATKENIASLEENIQLQNFYLDTKVYPKFFELDNEFHQILFSIANKNQTYHLMESMMIHFDRVRMIRLHTNSEVRELLDDHKAILDAVKQKEKNKAVSLMTMHLSRYKVDEEIVRQIGPDYFV